MRPLPKLVALLTVVAATLTSTAGLANAVTPSVSAVTPVWGTYQSVAPARVLDTRDGTGAPKAAIGPGETLNLSVSGAAGVPATFVSAVVLNVTVTSATSPGYLTVFPAGVTRPTASSINFVAGTDRANMVIAQLGTIGTDAGKVSIYNPIGSVQVIADVMGYYLADGAATAGGLYETVVPGRMFDSRDPGSGGPLALAPGEAVSVPVDYNYDPALDLNAHITALAVNITAVSPTRRGYLAAWDGGSVKPTTSTLNFAAGTDTANMAIVPVGPCIGCGESTGLPSITVVNGSVGTVDVLVDIVGFYLEGLPVDPSTGLLIGERLRFSPLAPTRIVDTRIGQGTTTLKGASAKTVTMLGSVVGRGTVALVTNTTAVRPTLPVYLTLWPDYGQARPLVSNLNAARGSTVANATITDILQVWDPTSHEFLGGEFSIYNSQGTTDVVLDVVGTMEYVPTLVSGAAPSGAASSGAASPRIWKSNATAQPVR